MAEKIFADGVYFDNPNVNAPSYVLGKLSFKVAKAVAFLQEHQKANGYVDCDVLIAKDSGKPYVALNTFVPQKPDSLNDEPQEDEHSAIPF